MSYSPKCLYNRLKRIPKSKWGMNRYFNHETGQKCALGHLRKVIKDADSIYTRNTKLSLYMEDLFVDKLGVHPVGVNDGLDKNFTQSHPKDRILAALEKIMELK